MPRNRDSALNKTKTFNIINPIQNATEDGVFKLSRTSLEKYKANLYTLIFTGEGQRVMMPTFGTRIPYLLFEPMSEDIYNTIDKEIRDKTQYWIPEIIIDDIDFGDRASDVENNKISIKISFHLNVDPTIKDFIEIEMGV